MPDPMSAPSSHHSSFPSSYSAGAVMCSRNTQTGLSRQPPPRVSRHQLPVALLPHRSSQRFHAVQPPLPPPLVCLRLPPKISALNKRNSISVGLRLSLSPPSSPLSGSSSGFRFT